MRKLIKEWGEIARSGNALINKLKAENEKLKQNLINDTEIIAKLLAENGELRREVKDSYIKGLIHGKE